METVDLASFQLECRSPCITGEVSKRRRHVVNSLGLYSDDTGTRRLPSNRYVVVAPDLCAAGFLLTQLIHSFIRTDFY